MRRTNKARRKWKVKSHKKMTERQCVKPIRTNRLISTTNLTRPIRERTRKVKIKTESLTHSEKHANDKLSYLSL